MITSKREKKPESGIHQEFHGEVNHLREISFSNLNFSVSVKSTFEKDSFDFLVHRALLILKKIKKE